MVEEESQAGAQDRGPDVGVIGPLESGKGPTLDSFDIRNSSGGRGVV